MTLYESVLIERLSHDGRGIAHINNQVVFVEGALPKEVVSLEITKRHRRYLEGKVIAVSTVAPERVEPPCPHFSICGGCSLQHLSPEGQRQHKERTLLEQMQHIGHTQPDHLLPPLSGPSLQYRRKARLGVRFVPKKGGILVGFREKNPRFLANLSRCDILATPVNDLITPLKTLINEMEGREYIPQIEVAIGDDVTGLIFRHMHPLSLADKNRLCRFGETYQIKIYLQPGNADSVICLYPEAASVLLYYTLPTQGLRLHFHPTHFVQVNASVNQALVNAALFHLDLQPTDRVLDLFCGLGNFSLPIAQKAHHVVGVEGDERMVHQARANADFNHLRNTSFFAANLEAPLQIHPWFAESWTKILIDPPRAGAKAAIEALAEKPVQRMVYISCNPATLARDADVLVNQQGYRLAHLGIIDMFPQTSHVESLAVFDR